MTIVNLTQHIATPEQGAQGVFDLPLEDRQAVKNLLTFKELPTHADIRKRAKYLAEFALETVKRKHGKQTTTEILAHLQDQPVAVMIGGAPWLMKALEEELDAVFLVPVYAFSVREVVEEPQEDGSIKKTVVFKHQGFVTGV